MTKPLKYKITLKDPIKAVNTLVQRAMSSGFRDKSNDICRKCGKKGHWARDCPLNRSQGRPRFNRNNTKKSNSSSKWAPPKNGESEIKHIDGKKKYWCGKCKRWTNNHTTENHKSREELKKSSPSANIARVSFNMHPSAYKVTCGPVK